MMIQFTVNVPFKEGLHARPAAELVNICKTAEAEITLTKDDLAINPKSILGILTLAASHEDELTFTIDGSDESIYEEKIKAFFEK